MIACLNGKIAIVIDQMGNTSEDGKKTMHWNIHSLETLETA